MFARGSTVCGEGRHHSPNRLRSMTTNSQLPASIVTSHSASERNAGPTMGNWVKRLMALTFVC